MLAPLNLYYTLHADRTMARIATTTFPILLLRMYEIMLLMLLFPFKFII